MAANVLQVKRENGLCTITLNRPDKLNALNREFFDELKTLLDLLEGDKTVRVLILTAAGDKAFCVGADLKERQTMNDKAVLQRFELVRQLYLRLERLPFPLIAAINGHALGGGLELALTCDLRIAVETATMGLPEVDLAIIPGNGGTQRLARLVGMAKALELVLLAKRFTAKEALGYGVVNAVAPPGELMNQARAWATKMLESGPLALRQAKAAIRLGVDRTFEHGLQVEIDSYRALLPTKDRQEGLKAFVEKRKPVYKGE